MKKILLLLLSLLLFTGCAMSPDEKEKTGSQLIVTFYVKGKININERDEHNLLRNYFIAINCDNSDGTYGPLPVVYKSSGAYGWGNGWGTSSQATSSLGITSFLEYNQANSQGNFYEIIPETQLRQYSQPITPTSCELTDDGKGIRAIFDYSLIESSFVSAENIKKLQINIITNNLIISNTTESTPGRRFDALGTSTSEGFVDVIANRSYTYSGSDEEGDVDDEDLDITKWTIQIDHIDSTE